MKIIKVKGCFDCPYRGWRDIRIPICTRTHKDLILPWTSLEIKKYTHENCPLKEEEK